jgi:hypothetical protein
LKNEQGPVLKIPKLPGKNVCKVCKELGRDIEAGANGYCPRHDTKTFWDDEEIARRKG